MKLRRLRVYFSVLNGEIELTNPHLHAFCRRNSVIVVKNVNSLASLWYLRVCCKALIRSFPADIRLLKVHNKNTRTRCEILSKLTIKTPVVSFCCLYS